MEEESLMDAADRLYDQRRDDEREHLENWKKSPEGKCRFCGYPIHDEDSRFVAERVCREHGRWEWDC